MPIQPKRICTYPGCNTLVLEGRCHAHPYPVSERKRPPSRHYKTTAWQRTRAAVLKEYRVCQYRYKCEGAWATDVDHKDNDQHNNEPSNLVACCRRCHSYKTATFDMKRTGGKFNGRK